MDYFRNNMGKCKTMLLVTRHSSFRLLRGLDLDELLNSVQDVF